MFTAQESTHQDRVEHRDPAERAEERRARPRVVAALALGKGVLGKLFEVAATRRAQVIVHVMYDLAG